MIYMLDTDTIKQSTSWFRFSSWGSIAESDEISDSKSTYRILIHIYSLARD